MKLSHAEATQLFKGLLAAFPNPGKLEIILGQPPMNTSLARIVTGGTLDDEQIAGVLTYVRREWGQGADPIEPATVAAIRKATAGRARPWTDAELAAPGGRGVQR